MLCRTLADQIWMKDSTTRACCLHRKPEAPDWMGSMNPFWQTLDQIFGAHFNATTNETDSYFTTFYHPVITLHSRPDPCPYPHLAGPS